MMLRMSRYPSLFALSAFAIAACGDNSPNLKPETMSSGATSTVATNSSTSNKPNPDPNPNPGSTGKVTPKTTEGMKTTNSTPTNTSSKTSSTKPGTTSTSTSSGTGPSTDGNACKPSQIVCAPGVCCESNQDCVNGACLAACASQLRCGDALAECCEGNEVCNGKACEVPGKDCSENVDCPTQTYCEPTLKKCLAQIEGAKCEVKPKFSDVRLDHVEWFWDQADIISIPLVADLDGDGINEVIVNTTNEQPTGSPTPSIEHGRIVILSGKTGKVLRDLDPKKDSKYFGTNGRSTLAVGDVDGDNKPDIIFAGRKKANNLKTTNGVPDYTDHDTLIHAYSYAKDAILWTAHTGGPNKASTDYKEVKVLVHNGAPTMVNLDDDSQAEVIFGAMIIDHDGEVVWNHENKGPSFGSPANYAGGIAVAADINGDTKPEIITGRDAWKIDSWAQGKGPGGSAKVMVSKLWNANEVNKTVTIGDGYPAVADLDLDKQPEIILVADGQLVILDRFGQLWCGKESCAVMEDRTQPYELPGTPGAKMNANTVNYGGPPTVADFDGDGRPEVGVADYAFYAVYDFNRVIGGVGESIPMSAIPTSAKLKQGDIFTRWRATTQDRSSSATGSSVFDFQGDGAAEVIYGDECQLHVYDGATGNKLVQVPNSSATIHEYPVIADVDGDGRTEILAVANRISTGTGHKCAETKKGIYVYGDRKDLWVPTRPLWTQHSYHVTNADKLGNPPKQEAPNWKDLGLNNYRQNTQGYGVFNAPDLQVRLSADLSKCDNGQILLIATVRNAGSRGVNAGVEVNFFEGKNSSGKQIGSQTTSKALLPGASTTVQLPLVAKKGQALPDIYVHVDGKGQDNGAIEECLEDNNGDVGSGLVCPAK